MNKQTLFVTLTTAALMCGCQSSKVKISGRFVGGDAKNIYLEQVLPLTQSVDSAALAPDGSYRWNSGAWRRPPSLYNVIYDGERIPLLIAGGDRVTVGSVGSVIRNYTVGGSSESELLREFSWPSSRRAAAGEHGHGIRAQTHGRGAQVADQGVYGRILPHPPRAAAVHHRAQGVVGGGLRPLPAASGRQLPVQRRQGRGLLPYGCRGVAEELPRIALPG